MKTMIREVQIRYDEELGYSERQIEKQLIIALEGLLLPEGDDALDAVRSVAICSALEKRTSTREKI